MTVKIDTIQEARPFASLPAPAREALAERAREIDFSEDERLVPLGQPPQRLLVVIEGLVKLVGVSANGHERILYVHRPGDVVGPGVLLDNPPRDHEVAAMCDGRALALGKRDLLIVGRSHPSVILALAREVSRQLSTMTERMMAATSTEVPVRISRILLEFADGQGGEESGELVPLAHPLTHEIMAQIVGASRPHTSTVLRDLEDLDAVQRRSRRGLLVRPNRLQQIVETGDIEELLDSDRSGRPVAVVD